MYTIIIIAVSLAVLSAFIYICCFIFGTLAKALFWLLLRLPAALILWSFGILCLLSLLLIPVGIKLLKFGFNLLDTGLN